MSSSELNIFIVIAILVFAFGHITGVWASWYLMEYHRAAEGKQNSDAGSRSPALDTTTPRGKEKVSEMKS